MTFAPAWCLRTRVETGTLPPPARELSAHRLRKQTRLLRVGDLVGGAYEVRRLIGQGGMGQVYEGYDRLFRRRVALKLMWPRATATLLDEAQALATLKHPSIVELYAAGMFGETPYLVLERVDGTTLDAFLRARKRSVAPLGVGETLEKSARIADALAVVHAAGLVHRDVKPANILLASGPARRVVLSDFGICQSEDHLTRKGALVSGSPSYMAPETIRNASQPGTRYLVDIYALGVVTFEMLAGRAPFVHENVRKLFSMHVREPAPDVRALRPDVPEEVATLLLDMLSKDPKARPRRADDVAARLRRLQRRASGESAMPR
jgi:eukaryotic-like serine/threonine-protein kinase